VSGVLFNSGNDKKMQKNKPSTATATAGKIIPLGDRVLIKESEKNGSRQTASGIIIPETVNEDKGAKKGFVIAVGEGRYEDGKLLPMKVAIGDMVLYSWGDSLKVDGEDYIVVNESNVLAIIK
jgi:chaperonin GroES